MLPRQTPVLPKHEVVVITGGSAGVGRATARRFAREGAWIGLLARDADRLEEVKLEIEKLGGKVVVHAGDAADPAAHEQIAELTEQTFGPLDIWINNATRSVLLAVADMPPDEIRRVTDVAYLGVVFGTQAALKRMRPRDHGTIVQVGSALAYRSVPYHSAYCGAKHAVRGFTDSLRTELKQERRNIGLTMVQLPAIEPPGAVDGKWSPQPEKMLATIDAAEQAADAIWWAAHHRRREVYVGYRSALGARLARFVSAVLGGPLARRSFGERQPARAVQKTESRWRTDKEIYVPRSAFDPESPSGALELSISKRRSAWLWAFVGMAGAMAFAWRRKNMVRAPVWSRR